MSMMPAVSGDAPALQRSPAGMGTPLVTVLGVVEGEILSYLEAHGASTMRRIIRMLEWPTMVVVMGVGALIRQGLVRGIRRDLEVVLEPASPDGPSRGEPA